MIERRIKICANSSYGGVFVYNREEEIIEQYEVEVKSTAKGRRKEGEPISARHQRAEK